MCVVCFFRPLKRQSRLLCLGSSVPIEIGEMDGRNAGSAVIGFVNGMYIIQFHSSRAHTHTHTRLKVKIFSYSLRKPFGRKKRTHIHRDSWRLFFFVARKLGMTQRKTEHVTT